MDIKSYRDSPNEITRTKKLVELLPNNCHSVLEVGCRDGHLTRILSTRYENVTALDLSLPHIDIENVRCVVGNASSLPFEDNTFDLVICTEVLEHIPKPHLEQACAELYRVCRKHALIGVPFEQDIRCGKTTCPKCKKVNPPWGHVNSFTKDELLSHFCEMKTDRIDYLGTTKSRTNFLSSILMTISGNPWGTYYQEETCIHCGSEIYNISERTFSLRLISKIALEIERVYEILCPAKCKPTHIHVLLSKPSSTGCACQ